MEPNDKICAESKKQTQTTTKKRTRIVLTVLGHIVVAAIIFAIHVPEKICRDALSPEYIDSSISNAFAGSVIGDHRSDIIRLWGEPKYTTAKGNTDFYEVTHSKYYTGIYFTYDEDNRVCGLSLE